MDLFLNAERQQKKRYENYYDDLIKLSENQKGSTQ